MYKNIKWEKNKKKFKITNSNSKMTLRARPDRPFELQKEPAKSKYIKVKDRVKEYMVISPVATVASTSNNIPDVLAYVNANIPDIITDTSPNVSFNGPIIKIDFELKYATKHPLMYEYINHQ